MEADLLLGSHHILVARSEDLIDLGNRLCAVSHRTNSLYATSLENLADSSDASRYEDGWINLTIASRRRAEYNLLATCYFGWGSQHENGREKRGRTTRDIETYLLDGYALLPTYHTGLRLHLLAAEFLSLVESLDVVVGQLDGGLEFCTYQLFGFLHLFVGNSKCRQINMVEFQFIAFYGIIATLLDISQNG